MSLNAGQKAAFNYLVKKKKGLYRIDGFAGTGKTYLAVKIIKYLLKKNKKWTCLILCPTHQAKVQFSSRLPPDPRITVSTIASFLIQYPVKEVTGELKFLAGGYAGHADDLIIVDEVSMASGYEISEINKASASSLVIHLGDLYQLRPVMKKGPAEVLDKIKTFKLTEQQRNSGPILEAVNKVRESMEQKMPVPYPTKSIEQLDQNGQISSVTVHTDRQVFLQDFLTKLKQSKKPYETVYLAYTNDSVNKMRVRCHVALYGKKVFNVGQYVRLASPCAAGYTGNLCKIRKIVAKIKDRIAEMDMIVYTLRLKCLDTGIVGEVKCVSPKNQKLIETRLEELYKLSSKYFKRDKALYDHYQWCIEELRRFTLLKSPFAQTIHTSQGRSIACVYVDTHDIEEKGTDKKRLMYVGLSRAQNYLNTVRIDRALKVSFSNSRRKRREEKKNNAGKRKKG